MTKNEKIKQIEFSIKQVLNNEPECEWNHNIKFDDELNNILIDDFNGNEIENIFEK